MIGVGWWLAFAGAPAPDPSLGWTAPAPCPTQAAVARRVDGLLGGADPRSDVAFVATVTADDGSFALELVTRWSDGRADRREMSSPSCDRLADAAALMVAIALDPVGTADRVGGGPARRRLHGRVPRSVRHTTAPRERDAPPVDTGPPAILALRPTFVADWGTLPGLAPGVGLAAVVQWKLLRFELAGSYWFSRRASRPSLIKQGAWVAAGGVAPRVCVAPATGNVSFPLCLGVDIGAKRSRGIGTDLRTPRHSLYVSAVGGPMLHWAFVPRAALTLGLDVAIPLRQWAVVTADGEELHRSEAVVLRPAVGVEVRL